jgi:acetyl esterase/lipase
MLEQFQLQDTTGSMLTRVAVCMTTLLHGLWRIVSRVWLIVALTVLLLRAIGRFFPLFAHYIGVGRKWVAKLLRLSLFASVLSPAWVKAGAFYFSHSVLRDVRYGNKPRNYCDIYTVVGYVVDSSPDRDVRNKKDLPVIVLVMGGAWIIGYKAWSALLAKYLSENGDTSSTQQ